MPAIDRNRGANDPVESEMKPISQALALFGRERGLWKFAIQPLLWAALAYLLIVLLTAGIGARLGERVAQEVGVSAASGGAIGAAAGFVLTVVLGGSIYLALVGLVSGFGFDRLCAEVERRAFGRLLGQPVGFAAGLSDGILRALLASLLGLLGLCLSGTVVAPWLIASLLALLDATAPALLRRGIGLGRQFGAARRLPGALPFALIAGVIVLIPAVNVLALPILIAAGTILVGEREASFREASLRVPPSSSR